MDVGSLGIFLAFGVENLIYEWEELGVFQFLLPFLLIFAVVFGVLSYMKIFGDSKGIHIIIAIVIGLLAVRTPIFADVLREVSPRLGVGLVLILGFLILGGLFIPKSARGLMGWILFGIAAAIFIIILAQLYGIFGLGSGGFLGGFDSSNVIPIVVLAALMIGLIVAVAVGGGSNNTVVDKAKEVLAPLFGK